MFLPQPGLGLRANAILWAVLLSASVAISVALEMAHLPAALLLGPMLAAILLGFNGRAVAVPRPAFMMAQGVVGTMMARAMPPNVLGEILSVWPIVLIGVASVVLTANAIGYVLARFRVLPGTTAVWGASPGAATAMVIMAEAYGGDTRLVAVMQYLRVLIVATMASLAARFYLDATITGGTAADWFPPIDWVNFAGTLAVIAAGLVLSRIFRLTTGAMILPMLFAIGLQGAGLLTVELPPVLLAVSYAVCGWAIGGRFNRDIIAYAARALPTILLAIVALVAICAVYAGILSSVTGVDFLTAYLATSPGGADSVAIIAASSNVDMSFVMAMQTMRFFMVLFTGPSTARFIAARVSLWDVPSGR
ncbi:AbrB family transcriptional regulator [Pleomorphomonas sp. JP5]|uniref:AbrB family transcriptional regulator n=1 Tax=Pleomorphomonas sp. JP5 TaxID=2942998 RepID=UPI002044CAD0|nr:AbrB family transcriptional regulator [Pleomorphomonas sp. JP5]MCM5560018.1 AbrB family transcriptional regulator [Pleomorphomonas sp. JP5]